MSDYWEPCDFCGDNVERYGYQRDVVIGKRSLVACCNACEGGLHQIAEAGDKRVQEQAYERVRTELGLKVVEAALP
jgi:hypothetical protein